eukprot:TRINITY_DN26354_c0_g1_i3.p1 TRINITY_DN26354_c0_g1~~TRINITY_DN26354_c0_g1_i3.p1  ORF type:complete len:540 (+),score=215.33 TRINITY_DN26354_c0_g1_i3:138-1757(+)
MFSKLKDWNKKSRGSQDEEEAPAETAPPPTTTQDSAASSGGMFGKLKAKKGSHEAGGSGGEIDEVPREAPEPVQAEAGGGGGGGMFGKLKESASSQPASSSPNETQASSGLFGKLKQKKGGSGGSLEETPAEAAETAPVEEPVEGESMFSKLRAKSQEQTPASPPVVESSSAGESPTQGGLFGKLKSKSMEDKGVVSSASVEEDAGMFSKLKGKTGSQGSQASFGEEEEYVLSAEELRQIQLEAAAAEGLNDMDDEDLEHYDGSIDGHIDVVEEDIDGFEQSAITNAMDNIETNIFNLLQLEKEIVIESQQAWDALISSVGSREAAGEAIYSSIYEADTTLQSLFTTPRGVQAQRFRAALENVMKALGDPSQLKQLVETIGFAHLSFDINTSRVIVFREALLDLLEVELGDSFTPNARQGWLSLLNYIGGASIYVKVHYADRLRMLHMTWTEANKGDRAIDDIKLPTQSGEAKEEKQEQSQNASQDPEKKLKQDPQLAGHVPQGYSEMFQFNCALMGFGNSEWMCEVVRNPGRAEERTS